MSDNKYRALSEEEIAALEDRGCRAGDWSKVHVAAEFDPSRFHGIVFHGKVEIARQSGEILLSDGRKKSCGIYNASLENVAIGENCYIANVHVGISNVNIGTGVAIENVGEIICEGESTFGNGHAIDVLNEGGGREMNICAQSNAQVAYLTIMYRDNQPLIDGLHKISDAFCAQIHSNRATVGQNSRIKNCTKITNVWIGESAVLDGVLSLREGTVASSAEAPTSVGSGVVAEHFIIQKGASVMDGAMVASSLVGEACKVGKQVSLENTVLYANSEAFHSELCSVFGGPYTVTHHRSTLLIAGYFSFYNAGSATNQSNHMYKLGPVHQGILERGCKTGSSAYLLWPARVGAFSAVLGKHHANFDTTNLPFSYISEEGGRSFIIPGMNYFTTGTFRDALKWPARDKRTVSNKLDFIIFDVLSPYTGQKVIRGQEILNDLSERSQKSQTFVSFKGIHMKRLLLKTCSRYYQLILDKYFGDIVIKRMQHKSAGTLADLFTNDSDQFVSHEDQWVDICGLICRKNRLEHFTAAVSSGEIQSYAQIQTALQAIYTTYHEDEWQWFLAQYAHMNGHPLQEESSGNWQAFMERWNTASRKLLKMVLSDAGKEFEGNVKTGFGVDGNQDADFANVRGVFDENSFKQQLEKDMQSADARYEDFMKLLV
ncbi:MAG: DUF4954 family protein [Calditrichaeota bacterium]|nr:MAG: DUF4954 family protein [Calditrichota bacterium]